MGRSVGRCPVLPCPEDTVVTAGGERGNAPSSARCKWQQETDTAAVAMRQRSTHCCAAVNFRPTRSARESLSNGHQLRDPLGVGTPPQPCVRVAAVPPGPAAPGSLGPGRCALRLHAASRAGRAEPRARVPARVRGAARLRAAEPQRRRGPGGRRGAADGAAGSGGGGGGGAPRSRRAAPGSGEAAARRGSLVAGGGGAPDARGGQKMCHGKQASGGGALPAARRRALAAALWLRLALSLGPGPAAGGFDDLQACADPGAPEHGYKTPSAGVFFESVVVRFHCQEGYRLNGTSKKLCVRHFNGSLSWKPSDKPVCLQEVTDCLVPHVEDAKIHNKTYRTGDKLIISCHEGFQIRYPDLDNMVSICQDDGTWDNLPICQGCLRPLVLPHSYINISEFESSFSVGTVVYYQCFPGYKLEGAEFLECMYNLIWSDSPPRCLDVEVCPLPPMVSHGDYICHPRPCERYNHGTVVEFYCDPGYTLTNDYKYITCQYGEWFPSYQVYCVKTEQTWPNTQETLLTTWKIVAFTATSVLLVLLLVILARMFQTKFKAHFLPRGNQEGSVGDPDFVVVDGVPVMLPSYDEAVSSSLNALAPGYSATVDQGHVLQTEDQSPPAYPGPRITDMLPSEFESCESQSVSSELLQSLYSPPVCQAAVLASSDRTDASRSTAGEAVSTSPRIDITDEIPLMEEDP
ncbi:sushi domain-containing protein 4 [Tympanuchus pallidicinctus]|uniref:sushi domain-containing protein 4 n=1 Tax=Tympanuchus pallidicinctus TaxID=109042 RepID=UPI0022872D39|nr:sushi domain-containing protein 4 [Tympanuchus pallidicinctus]